MAEKKLIPVQGVDQVGIIRDVPAHALPPNAWSDGRNVYFKNGTVYKRQGTVQAFTPIPPNPEEGEAPSAATEDREIAHLAYWPNPDQRVYIEVLRDLTGGTPGTYTLRAIDEEDNRHVVSLGNPDAAIPITREDPIEDRDWTTSLFTGGHNIIVNANRYPPGYVDRTGADAFRLRLLPGWETTNPAGETPATTNNATPPVARTQFTTAKVVRGIGNRMFAGNFTFRNVNADANMQTEAGSYPGTLRISALAPAGDVPATWDPFDVDNPGADEFELSNTSPVQDIVALQGQAIVYTTNSIHSVSFQGLEAVVRNVADGYGALTTGAVLEFDGRHFVVGSNDLYVFSGHPGSIQSVSDQKVREFFFEDINPRAEIQANMFLLRDSERDEIQIYYPSVLSTEQCDRFLAWNYRNNTWSYNETNNVITGVVGPIRGGGVANTEIRVDGNGAIATPTGNTMEPVAVSEQQTITVAETLTAPLTERQLIRFDGNGVEFDDEEFSISVPQDVYPGNEETATFSFSTDFVSGSPGSANGNTAANGTLPSNAVNIAGNTGLTLIAIDRDATQAQMTRTPTRTTAGTETEFVNGSDGDRARTVVAERFIQTFTIPAGTRVTRGTRNGGRGSNDVYNLGNAITAGGVTIPAQTYVNPNATRTGPIVNDAAGNGATLWVTDRDTGAFDSGFTEIYIGGTLVFRSGSDSTAARNTQNAATWRAFRWRIRSQTAENGYVPDVAGAEATINEITGVITFPRSTRQRVGYQLRNGTGQDFHTITSTVGGLTIHNGRLNAGANSAERLFTSVSVRPWVVDLGQTATAALTGMGLPTINHTFAPNITENQAAIDLAAAINAASTVTGGIDDRNITAVASGRGINVTYETRTTTSSLELALNTTPGGFGTVTRSAVVAADTTRTRYTIAIGGTASAASTIGVADFTDDGDTIEQQLAEEVVRLANATPEIVRPSSSTQPADVPWDVVRRNDESIINTHSNRDFTLTITNANMVGRRMMVTLNDVVTATDGHTADSVSFSTPNGIFVAAASLRSGESATDFATRVLPMVNTAVGWAATNPNDMQIVVEADTHERFEEPDGDGGFTQLFWLADHTPGNGINTSTSTFTREVTQQQRSELHTGRITIRDPRDGTTSAQFPFDGTTPTEIATQIAGFIDDTFAGVTVTTNGADIRLDYETADYLLTAARGLALNPTTGVRDANVANKTPTITYSNPGTPDFRPQTTEPTFEYGIAAYDELDETATSVRRGHPAIPVSGITVTFSFTSRASGEVLSSDSRMETFENTANEASMIGTIADLITARFTSFVSILAQDDEEIRLATRGFGSDNQLTLRLILDDFTLQDTPRSFIRENAATTIPQLTPDDFTGSNDPERPWLADTFNLARDVVVLATSKTISGSGFGFTFDAAPAGTITVNIPAWVSGTDYASGSRVSVGTNFFRRTAVTDGFDNTAQPGGADTSSFWAPSNDLNDAITGDSYESYVERIHNPMDGEVEYTKQAESVQLLLSEGDVDVQLGMTDSPGDDRSENLYLDETGEEVVRRTFFHEQDYKVDWRRHGRLFNIRISDPTRVIDASTGQPRTKDITDPETGWRLAGYGLSVGTEEKRGGRS